MGLTFIAIAFLACAWGFLLLPDLRARGRSPGRSNSVKSFQDQLSGLDRTRPQGSAGRPGGAPRTMAPRGPAPRATGQVRPRTAGRPTPLAGPVGAGRPSAPGRPGLGAASRPPAGVNGMPRTRAQAAQRRVHTLAVLGGVAALTLVSGLLISSTLLLVHLVVDAGLAAYVYLLWSRAAAQRSSRSTTLRSTDVDDFSPLQRRASGS